MSADEPNYADQYPGFTVTCDRRGSKEILLVDTRGSSEVSGLWGEVSLECQGCKASVEIVST